MQTFFCTYIYIIYFCRRNYHLKKMYTALDISSYYIKKNVSPLKLQKLLFYSQVWYFVKYKKLLFNDDIESWVLGPVVHNVWSHFRFIRRGDIINPSKAKDIIFDGKINDHLDQVWNIYGRYSGLQLVDITHNEDLWLNARGDISENQSSKTKIIITEESTTYLNLDSDGNIPPIVNKIEGIGSFNGNVSEELF